MADLRVAVLVVTGCGFTKLGDAVPGNDAPIDAAAARTCIDKWMAGTVQLGAPALLADVSSGSTERDPVLSPDELTLYVSSNRPTSQAMDVWSATRASVDAAFTTPALVTELGSANDETKLSITADGKYAVIGTARGGGAGGIDVWEASRSSVIAPFGTPVHTHMASINTGGSEHDPTINGTGLHLYYAPSTPAPQRIVVATRATMDDNFSAPATIAELNSGMSDADPTLSLDEKLIVFSSNRAGTGFGGGNLWYAVRPSVPGTFSAPALVPTVNTDANDSDPHLSSDGCRLYFASDTTGDWNIYIATVP